MTWSLYEGCGLIRELVDEIEEKMPWFSEKIKRRSNFLTIRQLKFFSIFYRYDWLSYIKEKKLTPLTQDIKYAIIDLFDRIDQEEKDSNHWVFWLLKLDTVLSSCLYDEFGKGLSESQNKGFQTVRIYYEFLRKTYEDRGLEIFEPFNIEPVKRFVKDQEQRGKIIRKFHIKKAEIAKRPPCPRCGAKGSQIQSKSPLRWLCKECGKSFNKFKIWKRRSK